MKALLLALFGKMFQKFITKIIAAFGFAFVTYTGFSIALGQIKNAVSDSTSSMPADIFNLLMIAGLGEGLAYIFGAFAFKLAITSMTKLTAVSPS